MQKPRPPNLRIVESSKSVNLPVSFYTCFFVKRNGHGCEG